MSTWNITARALLGRTVPNLEAYELGRLAAEPLGRTAVVSMGQDATMGVTLVADTDDPVAVLTQLRATLAQVLAERGHELVAWQSFEALTPMETDKRLDTATIPEMVNTEAFAALCGVSRQRISELETNRRAAETDGQPYAFPRPVVPGWWLRTAAEHYARTRKTKRGPTSRRDSVAALPTPWQRD